MNIMFLNNSNYNADSLHVCFIKQVYGSLFLFYSHNYGKLPLTGIASRISVYFVVILSTYLRSSFFFGRFCVLSNRSERCSTVRYVERYRALTLCFFLYKSFLS